MAVETFNASTTWTCPSGVTEVQVECWGGGGGGGSSGGGGGGGGAYSKANAISVTPGNDYTVHVGASGAGSVDSYFIDNSTVLAKGGVTGEGSLGGGLGGAGGAAASGVGDTKFSGGDGASFVTNGGGGGSSAGTASDGGDGSGSTGGTAPSGGGNGGNGGTNADGQTGTAPGGGGGGGDDGFPAKSGGPGAAGRVVLTYVDPPPSAGGFQRTTLWAG